METLYISDLDGTLLNEKAELSNSSKEILNGLLEQGLCFSVATARSPATVFPILSGLKLSLPIIMMNGVLIYDMGEKRYDLVLPIPRESFLKAAEIMKNYHVTGFVYTLEGEELIAWYENLDYKAAYDFYEERRRKYQKHFERTEDFRNFPREAIYISLLNEEERLRPVYDALKEDPLLSLAFYRDVYSEKLWYLEICSHKASKKNALCRLKEILCPKKVAAFGDNLNDLPLFEESDERYAVSNALPKVRDQADQVIGSNREDGVANYLKKCWKSRDNGPKATIMREY